MGKMIRGKIQGMNLWAKIALTVMLTLVVSVVMYDGLYKPRNTFAAVTIGSEIPATNVTYAATGSASTTVSGSYTVGLGPQRLLLVVVQWEGASGATASITSATYGLQNLTPVASTTGFREKVWIGYLNEQGIAAAQAAGNSTLSVSISNSLTPSAGTVLKAGWFSSVNQTTPIYHSVTGGNDAPSAATHALGNLNVVNGGRAYYFETTNSGVTYTEPAGYSPALYDGNDPTANYALTAAVKPITATGTENPTITQSAATRYSFVGVSINPASALSNNADLSNLALSTGTLTPSFASGTTSYTASVSNATTSITVTPTEADTTATTTVNGVAVASGSASGPIALAVGANTINTVVTAQDGTTTKTYSVVVTRAAAASNNANLSNLVLSAGTLTPTFASATTSYTASVSNATTSITVTPTEADTTATTTVNGVAVNSGSPSGPIALAVGANTINTVVTAQDGTTTKTYSVVVTRAAAVSNNANLSNLVLSAGTLTPTFASATTSYTASVSNATTSITVTPTEADTTATTTVNGVAVTSGSASGPIALAVGANTINTVVTAQDGTTTKTYAVVVTRAASGTANPLIHSSDNLSTTYGTWGTGYTCATCHDPSTTNIKRIATTINGKAVSFLQVTGAQNSYGNDARTRLGKSTNVCEVCHTQTKYHRYSSNSVTNPLPGGYAHNNKKDCISCHTHNTAFAASGACDSCHGYPPGVNGGTLLSPSTGVPSAGAHLVHNSTRGIQCDTCHHGSQMLATGNTSGDGTLMIGFNINGSNFPGFPGSVTFGSFTAKSPINGYSYVSGSAGTVVQQSAAGRYSCNVYCHGNWPGANGSKNASWTGGAAEAACGTCHAASTATPPTSWPTSNAHAKHAGNGAGQYQKACSTCHTVTGSNSHVNGTVNINLANGTYSRTTGIANPATANGSCRATYCHSRGTSFSTFTGNTKPAWTTAGPLSCNACHSYVSATQGPNYANGTPKANSHTVHAGRTCESCHSTVVNAAGAISSPLLHANQQYNVIPLAANFVLTNTPSPTVPASCNTITCHGGNNAPATWGTTLNCNGCHPIAGLRGAHGLHVNTALVPTLYNYTANRSTLAAYNFGCSNCHPQDATPGTGKHLNGVIDVTLYPTNTGAGGVVSNLRSRNTAATAEGLAATKGASGIYGTSGTSVRCSASYCHSNAYAANQRFIDSPNWYATFSGDKCAMCHGNSPNATDPVNQPGSPAHYSKNFLGFANVSGGHGIGIHANNIFNGGIGKATAGNTATSSHGNANTSTTISCNMCHNKTVTSYANDRNKACVSCHTALPKNPAELINDKRVHVNGLINVDFAQIRVKSKAQMRNGEYVATAWSRTGGYKQSGSYDVSFKGLTTATQWNGTTKTCANIACHNGISVTWTSTGGATTCNSCHQ